MSDSDTPSAALAQALEAADKAGALVSEQVRSIVQSAHERGTELIELAERDAAAIRSRAAGGLTALLRRLEETEHSLAAAAEDGPDPAVALRMIRSETALVRELLAELGVDVPARPAEPPPPAEDTVTPDADLVDPLAGVADPLSPEALQVVEKAGPPPMDDVPDLADAPEVDQGQRSDAPPDETDDAVVASTQAQERVVASDDDELVESFDVGLTALREARKQGNEEQTSYWQTYLDAIVNEAAGRQDFGRAAMADDVPKRRRKKAEKRYRPLMVARAEHLER